MSQLFTNNASGTLNVQLETGVTTLTLEAGEAALFPAPTGADFAVATIENVAGDIEIVKITNNDTPSTDVLTIVREQEGTTSADPFVTGSRVELRMTAATFDEFIQRSGATMTGELNMNDEVLRDPIITNGEARNLTLRGIDGGTANQIVVPTAGGAPTLGGQVIYHAGNLSATETTDHTAVTITAGSGLSYSVGGTDISASATIDVDISALTTVEGTALAADDIVYVSNGGAGKAMQVQAMGLRAKLGQGSQTLAANDMNSIMEFTGTATLTLPLDSSVPLPIGVPVVLNVKHATQVLTVAAATSVTLVSVFHPAGAEESDRVRAGGTALLYKTAADVWCLSGDILT